MARFLQSSFRWFLGLWLLIAVPAFAGQSALPAGTRITAENWHQYKEFMSSGLVALFSGRYFWRLGPDAEIQVGTTVPIALPKLFREDTDTFSRAVRLRHLSSGGTSLENYIAGVPFPDPTEPDLASKVLWNMYYRHSPRVVRSIIDAKSVDRYLNVSTLKLDYVSARLAHLSDPMTPHTLPLSRGVFLADYTEVILPEQSKYLAQDSLVYDDPERIEELYSFIPALRRVIRLSAAARCAPKTNSDFTPEDTRYGFHGQPSLFKVDLEGERKILALVHSTAAYSKWNSYIGSFSFPRPTVGKWELRDAYVINLRRLGPDAASYCYGKRTIYVDRETWVPLAAESYDRSLKLWKIHLIGYRPASIPLTDGDVTEGAGAAAGFHHLIDVQRNHATASLLVDVLVNEEAGKYGNITRYGIPSGLQQIMQ